MGGTFLLSYRTIYPLKVTFQTARAKENAVLAERRRLSAEACALAQQAQLPATLREAAEIATITTSRGVALLNEKVQVGVDHLSGQVGR